jgi:enolase-phosphatase E1
VTPAIRSVLLDIEGTTTPISFVTETLFPYARARLADFVAAEDVAALRAEREADRDDTAPSWNAADERASALAYLAWLMDRDRKSTALKDLQGRIWRGGFESGALVAPMYPDVPRALARWTREGRDVSIYSSGSVLAQRLLFAHADAGDLTPLLRAFFDTTTGPKRERKSYARIAERLGRAPREVLFVSDVVAELDAAKSAGCATVLALRPGNAPQPESTHELVRDLDRLLPASRGAARQT